MTTNYIKTMEDFLHSGSRLQMCLLCWSQAFLPVLCSLLPVLRPQSIVRHPEAQLVNFDSHTGSSNCTGCSVFPQQGPALDSKLFFVVVVVFVFCIREQSLTSFFAPRGWVRGAGDYWRFDPSPTPRGSVLQALAGL